MSVCHSSESKFAINMLAAYILFILYALFHLALADNVNKFSLPRNFHSMTFYRGLDLNRWKSGLNIDHSITAKSRFRLHQELNIILHHTPGFMRQWKVDEALDFDFSQEINTGYSAIVEGSWERFIDRNAIPYQQKFRPDVKFPALIFTNSAAAYYEPESNISKYYIGVGGKVSLPDFTQMEGAVGPIYENRQSITRSGMRLRGKLIGFQDISGLIAEGWMNRLNIGNDYGWKASYVGKYQLTEGASNRVSINYNQAKQYENLSGASVFGQRRDDQIRIVNELRSPASKLFTIVWHSELNRQRSTHIRDNSEISDLDFGWINRVEVVTSGESWQTVSHGGIDLQEQQYAGGLSQGNRKSLGLGVIYFPSFLDSVSLRSMVIKYRYDTPDDLDFNDRDELRYQIAFAAGRKISPDMGIAIKIETDLRHLVYIFRSRSGENRWHRTLRLTVDIPWQRGQFRNVSHYAVVSNYTDYDYFPAADDLSRVYRAFTLNDTVTVNLNENTSLEVNFAVIFDDHGKLQWSKWVQNLSEDGVGYTTAALGTWKNDLNLFKYGWSWHVRKTTIYQQSGNVLPGESTYSHGPILTLRSNLGERLRSDLTARWAYVIDRQRGNYTIPDVRYQLIWAIG